MQLPIGLRVMTPAERIRVVLALVGAFVAGSSACRPPFEPGCPFELAPGLNAELQVLGERRTAVVLVPESPGPHAAVFVFHGAGGDALTTISSMNLGAEVLIVGLNALDRAIPVGIWDDSSDSPDANADLALFDNVHACALEQLEVDSARVSVAGVSGGAFFAGFLVKRRGEALAAAALFSGLMRRGVDEGVTPMLMAYGGEEDRTAALDENGVFNGSFDYTARMREQVPLLRDAGHPVVACNTDAGHGVPDDAGDTMIRPFLFAHERGVPSPFLDQATAPRLPDFCSTTDVP